MQMEKAKATKEEYRIRGDESAFEKQCRVDGSETYQET